VFFLLSLASSIAFAGFNVTGSPADKRTWDKMIADCSRASKSFKAMVDKVNDPALGKTVNVTLVRNKKSVYVDSFSSGDVDLSDIEDYAKADPAKVIDRCQVLAHIIGERLYAACNPGTGYTTCHKLGGIVAENNYRADCGYTDTVVDHSGSADGSKACHQWNDGTLTYDAIAEERSETGVITNGALTVPGKMTISIDSSLPNADVINLPAYAGGGQRTVTGYSGVFTVELSPATVPNHALIHVTDVQIEAPAVDLVPAVAREKNHLGAGTVAPMTQSTGPNFLTLDPSGLQFGVINLKTGQIWVSYSGLITNDLYPPSSPLKIYSTVTGVYVPGTSALHLHTAAAFLDGDPGQTYGDW